MRETIKEFNDYLISNKAFISYQEYIVELHYHLYSQIDDKLIDIVLDMMEKKEEEYHIHHDMLFKFEVLKPNNRITCVKTKLRTNKLIQNVHYQITYKKGKHIRNFNYKQNIYLTSHAFKKCLINSRKMRIYKLYFDFIDKSNKYYNKYKIELNTIY